MWIFQKRMWSIQIDTCPTKCSRICLVFLIFLFPYVNICFIFIHWHWFVVFFLYVVWYLKADSKQSELAIHLSKETVSIKNLLKKIHSCYNLLLNYVDFYTNIWNLKKTHTWIRSFWNMNSKRKTMVRMYWLLHSILVSFFLLSRTLLS